MKVAIMQPYFMPYLGYFSLIKHTDMFILLDSVQHIRHGWIERNRILNQKEGWIYFQVPINKINGRETLIKDLSIDNRQPWKQKIFAQLENYKKRAPYYINTINLLRDLLANEYKNIVSLNKAALESVCCYLSIENNIRVYSEMGLDIERPNAPDEWALNICKVIGGVNEYWNPPGGMSFFNKGKYVSSGIELKFQRINLTPYSQKAPKFEEGLSIIDVIMFNDKTRVNEMLDNYELI